MNDTKLRNFFRVAETLNFTQAADELFMSQSVLSRQISAMEDELGFQLFSRTSKSVTLTPGGRAFYSVVKPMLGKYDSIIKTCRDMASGFYGGLEIGAISIHSIRKFTGLLKDFEQRYPKIKINLTSAMLETQFQYLAESQLDFFFGALTTGITEAYRDIFDHMVIGKNKFGVIIPKSHRHFKTPLEELSLSDFKDDTFIAFDNVVNDTDFVKNRCEQVGFSPKMLMAADVESVFLWMELDRGVTVLDETSVYASNRNYRFIPLPELGCNNTSIIWSRENENPSCRVFIEYLRGLDLSPSE